MREIKFRAKRSDEHDWGDSWYFGSLLSLHEPCRKYTAIVEECDNIAMIDNYAEHFYLLADEETIGQFTGVKDINGVEIYEGDLLLQGFRLEHRYETCVVSFECGAFVVKGYADTYNPDEIICSEDYIVDFGMVVVGNVHDNPELLEEKHD